MGSGLEAFFIGLASLGRHVIARARLVVTGAIVVVALAIVAEILKAPITAVDAFYQNHERTVNGILLGMFVVGVLLLVPGLWFLFTNRVSLKRQTVREIVLRGDGLAAWPHVRAHRDGGKGSGSLGVEMTIPFVRRLIAKGAWLRDPVWRSYFATIAGLHFTVLSVFTFVVMVGTPVVKMAFGGAVIYMIIRLVVALAMAEKSEPGTPVVRSESR